MYNVKVGDTFKNYPDACKKLGVEKKNGTNAKEKQFKDWRMYFDFVLDGRKIIVTEVYDTVRSREVDNRTLKTCETTECIIKILLSNARMIDFDYQYSFGKFYTELIGVVNKSIYVLYWSNDNDAIQSFCNANNVFSVTCFKRYMDSILATLKKCIIRSLNNMFKNNLVEFQEGYRFVYNTSYLEDGYRENYFYTDKLNDKIIDIETKVCNEIIEEHDELKKYNMKGRQLKRLLKRNNELKEEFNYGVNILLSTDNDCFDVFTDVIVECGCPSLPLVSLKNMIIRYNSVISFECIEFDKNYDRTEIDEAMSTLCSYLHRNACKECAISYKSIGDKFIETKLYPSLEILKDIILESSVFSNKKINFGKFEYKEEDLDEELCFIGCVSTNITA